MAGLEAEAQAEGAAEQAEQEQALRAAQKELAAMRRKLRQSERTAQAKQDELKKLQLSQVNNQSC